MQKEQENSVQIEQNCKDENLESEKKEFYKTTKIMFRTCFSQNKDIL